MLALIPSKLNDLAPYLVRFLELAGRERWFKRCDQLDADQRHSLARWKIVSDYHWLELAIGFQADVLSREGRLVPGLTDELILAALNFAATTAVIYPQLSSKGQRVLVGRLRDSLKAETGFASLYLEIDLARRLMGYGYNVEFADMEGKARYDLRFSQGAFIGEVECKSLSADAGRQIHRKDFYRFIEAITPALTAHVGLKRQEILLITLDARLPSDTSEQALLVEAVNSLLHDDTRRASQHSNFRLERQLYADCLNEAPSQERMFYKACNQAFGANTHVAGSLTEDGGCLVVMRSEREDDPSKPMLEAMRKATSQFTCERPAFIAIQEHGIEAADLMLPHVRRRTGILSYALFGNYGANHVNAIYITGFGAVVARDGQIFTPAFSVPNPMPRFAISPADAAPFLVSMSDIEYAAAIGAPLPAPNISDIPFDLPQDRL